MDVIKILNLIKNVSIPYKYETFPNFALAAFIGIPHMKSSRGTRSVQPRARSDERPDCLIKANVLRTRNLRTNSCVDQLDPVLALDAEET